MAKSWHRPTPFAKQSDAFLAQTAETRTIQLPLGGMIF
jgi:hypothetical protein